MFRRLALRATSRVVRTPFQGNKVSLRCFTEQVDPITETVRDFLEPAEFYGLLKENGIDFYTGVPDSLLKDYCAYVADTCPPDKHIITANEGSAIAVASGYHLATRKFPVVYMQNSGFGNAINPLLSLADAKIYSIPMLLLVGWRGEPGKKDEPQHLVQGKAMASMLTTCGINYEVLPDFIEGARETIASALQHMQTRKSPYALLVKRQCFTKYSLKNKEKDIYPLTREEILSLVLESLGKFDITVATTGFCSRELYELRQKAEEGHQRDFLTVGSMGHASAIACGIALNKPSRQVVTIDGDGAAIMHMGSFATVGKVGCKNFKHILINNGAHDSVGGQSTGAFQIDFPKIALACGYKYADIAATKEEVQQKMGELMKAEGPAFLEIRSKKGARKDLGRPKSSPAQNKADFMQFLEV